MIASTEHQTPRAGTGTPVNASSAAATASPAADARTAAAPTAHAHRTTARTVELLAPAGGPGPFAAAIAAGADAVYCGMGAFNARRKAENFTDEAFEAACRTAHLAGARVYVTVNIAIKDTEMPDALELVRRCARLGADAFIIQDWGLFSEVKRLLPDIEVHVSTQANVHDARGAAWCAAQGAERDTLSRELSLEEIRAISAVGIDLEVFSHGSICFCYSGLCTLSSFACQGRSANRGMCAQPCRLPYELVNEAGENLSAPGRERALCPRDNCTVDILGELVDAGAASLKLEGRMKAPDYVYSVTDAYRRALDAELARRGEKSAAGTSATAASDTDAECAAVRRQLKRCFNRDFTSAYFEGTSGDEMMSYERSNNRGQIVGAVCGFEPALRTRRDGKRVVAVRRDGRGPIGTAKLRLTEPVGAGDLLELRDDADPDQFLTALAREDAPAGAVIGLEVPRPMPAGARVRLIRSQEALDTAAAALKRAYPRKRAVHVQVQARLDKPFAVELTCADEPALSARVEGFTVEAARTRPVSREDLLEHVGRMGSSPFEAASFEIALDENCGMGFSAVHKVRAAACAALEEKILAPYDARAEKLAALPPFAQTALTAQACGARAAAPAASAPQAAAAVQARSVAAEADEKHGHAHAGHPASVAPREAPFVAALVTSLEGAKAARTAGAARVYLAVDDLLACGITPDAAAERGLIPYLDEVSRLADHERLDPWVRANEAVAVGNVSELALAAERGARAEVRPCLPVHNVACMDMLARNGAAAFWLSPELALEEIERIAPHAPAPVGVYVWGKPRVMTSEHCILMAAGRCIHNCAKCPLRRQRLFLKNIDGKLLPVRTDVHGRSHLYDAFPLDYTPQVGTLLAAGVTRFMVDGTLLSPQELSGAVTRAVRALAAAQAGRRPDLRATGASPGCLFTGVA